MTAGSDNPKSSIVEFANEVFEPSNPVEIPVTEFTHVRRIRVVLQSRIRSDYKFYINFKNGEDIVMQMNPRIHHKALVFNTFYNGHWQVEETVPMICPIVPNEAYTIDFVPTRFHSVFIYINDRFTYEFRERQPGFKVLSVEIGGDVLVHSLHFTMTDVGVQRLTHEVPSYAHFSKEIFQPPKECVLVFPVTSFTFGDRLRILLIPSFYTNRKFHISLKNGSEVVLNFEARTLESADSVDYSAHVVFNTCRNGVWEIEEQTAGRCPFVWSDLYTVEFAPSGHYSVYVRVNGRNIHEFRERHTGFKVSSVEIAGDLFVHSVHIP